MKRITALLLALIVTGCASTHTYQSSPQAYRAKGQEGQTQITGKVDQIFNNLGIHEANKVTVYFDGKPQIEGNLDKSQTGEIVGQPFNGKNTNASCSSKKVSDTWVELKCIIFIDNERAATLTM